MNVHIIRSVKNSFCQGQLPTEYMICLDGNKRLVMILLCDISLNVSKPVCFKLYFEPFNRRIIAKKWGWAVSPFCNISLSL